MTLERTKLRLDDYRNALSRLKEATRAQIDSDLLADAVIQRFGFTFELSWKLMKSYLSYQGIECNSPRQCIKEAFKINLIEHGDVWIDMLMDRNKTSHIYDEQEANEIYDKITSKYVDLLSLFMERVKQAIHDEEQVESNQVDNDLKANPDAQAK